jgi:hypothetical protein
MRSLPLAVLVVALGHVASAAPPHAWIGTFQPGEVVERCADCAKRTIHPCAGSVRVLSAGDGTLPTGDVVVVSPLLGMIAAGKVDNGRITLPWFHYDVRDADDGVLVLPGGTSVGFPRATPADVRDIGQALLRNEVLSHVRRSLAGLEVGGVDVDGDGKVDFAVTYGCNAWGDGQCQSKGQFFLVRRGPKWIEIE